MWILFLIKINEEIIKVKYNIILNIKFNNIYVYINYLNLIIIKMKCNIVFMLVICVNNIYILKLLFCLFLYCLENVLYSYCIKLERFLWLFNYFYVFLNKVLMIL